MKVYETQTGLTATEMTSKELAGIQRQLADDGIECNVCINIDTMDYELTATFDNIYEGLPQVNIGVHQGK